MKKILIGTATYNEVTNIEILINKINNLELNLDIIITFLNRILVKNKREYIVFFS